MSGDPTGDGPRAGIGRTICALPLSPGGRPTQLFQSVRRTDNGGRRSIGAPHGSDERTPLAEGACFAFHATGALCRCVLSTRLRNSSQTAAP